MVVGGRSGVAVVPGSIVVVGSSTDVAVVGTSVVAVVPGTIVVVEKIKIKNY